MDELVLSAVGLLGLLLVTAFMLRNAKKERDKFQSWTKSFKP